MRVILALVTVSLFLSLPSCAFGVTGAQFAFSQRAGSGSGTGDNNPIVGKRNTENLKISAVDAEDAAKAKVSKAYNNAAKECSEGKAKVMARAKVAAQSAKQSKESWAEWAKEKVEDLTAGIEEGRRFSETGDEGAKNRAEAAAERLKEKVSLPSRQRSAQEYDDAKANLSEAVHSVSRKVNETTGPWTEWGKEKLRELARQASDVKDNTKDQLEQANKQVQNATKSAEERAKVFKDRANEQAWGGVEEVEQQAQGAREVVKGGAKAAYQGATEEAQRISDGVKGAAQTLTDSAKALKQGAKDSVQSSAQAAKEKASAAADRAAGQARNMKEGVKWAAQEAADKARQVKEGVKDSVQSSAQAAKEKANAAADGAAGQAHNMKEGVKGAAQEAADKAQGATTWIGRKIKEALTAPEDQRRSDQQP
jgi:hypothetical protein